MKRVFCSILIVSGLLLSKRAQAQESLNITVCVASLHVHPGHKDQTNPGAGLEYLYSAPHFRIGPLTPFFAAGGAYCKDSNYQTPDGHKYDTEAPNRAYLHADAGLEFRPLDALRIGAAVRLGAANYRAVGELMDLPHIGDFVIAPVPDFRFFLDPKALGVEEGAALDVALRHLSLDVTTAVDPRIGKGGFVGFAFNWSIPLSRPNE
jgi:hypothetical protein